jgi:tetratricopeptide (TPR) repeat protein
MLSGDNTLQQKTHSKEWVFCLPKLGYNTPMQPQTKNMLLALAAGLIVGTGVYWIYTSNTRLLLPPASTTTPTQQVSSSTIGSAASAAASATSNVIKNGITFINGNGVVEEVPLVGGTSVSGQNGVTLQSLITEARVQKNAGNYAGAIATLNKAAALSPNDVVVNNNLGDIYMNFARDYPKAEASYKKVIAADSHYLDSYRHLFELYTTTSYKPTNTAAADIVAKALIALPTAYDLQVALARYYKNIGDVANARVQYEAAVANAKGQNLTTIAADIQAELNQLPK